jgi:preprotein translocase subunit SecG
MRNKEGDQKEDSKEKINSKPMRRVATIPAALFFANPFLLQVFSSHYATTIKLTFTIGCDRKNDCRLQ